MPRRIITIQELANAVVRYAEAYGLHISEEANDLWDMVEQIASRLPDPFSKAKKG